MYQHDDITERNFDRALENVKIGTFQTSKELTYTVDCLRGFCYFIDFLFSSLSARLPTRQTAAVFNLVTCQYLVRSLSPRSGDGCTNRNQLFHAMFYLARYRSAGTENANFTNFRNTIVSYGSILCAILTKLSRFLGDSMTLSYS